MIKAELPPLTSIGQIRAISKFTRQHPDSSQRDLETELQRYKDESLKQCGDGNGTRQISALEREVNYILSLR